MLDVWGVTDQWICISLGIENVAEVVRCGRLRWCGHAEFKRKDEGVIEYLHADTYL